MIVPLPKPWQIVERIERLEREQDMTLCIAAVAATGKDKCIVCCVDRKIQTETAGSESGFKMKKLPNGWGALLAGETGRAEELLGYYADLLDQGLSAPRNYAEELRRPAYRMKRQIIEEYTQAMFGVPYSEFLQMGARQEIPDATFLQTVSEIQRLDLRCDLILFVADSKRARIFTVYGNCAVTAESAFCTIGSGAIAANGWLHFRAQNSLMSLGQTMYHTYEAKRFAENAPGVGKESRFFCISSSGEARMLDKDSTYERLWKKYGPRDTNGHKEDLTRAIEDGFSSLPWKSVLGNI